MWSASAGLLVLALAACGDKGGEDSGAAGTSDGGSSDGGSSDGGSGDGGSSDGGSTDGGSTDGGSTDGGSETSEDEALLRAAIAGETDAATALRTIANRGGLPVQTADGDFLFACLCGDGTWSLAGDHDGWAGQEMTRAGELSWIEVEIPSPQDSLYKFWDGGSRWEPDPWSRRYGYDDYGEYSLVRAEAAHLERWFQVEGAGLQARRLRVWVPDGGVYTHALYAHDGQNLFDPDAAHGGWRLQESLPGQVLVVGIDNTSDRIEEYTHTTDRVHGTLYGGWGDDYAEYVRDVVRPMMEEAYGAPEVVGVMGSSLGGLISAWIGHRQPEDWDMVISMSGTMVWGSIGLDNTTVPEHWQAAGHRDVVLYVDSGGQGSCYDDDGDGVPDDDPSARDNYCENVWFAELMAEVGYEWNVDLYHWYETGAEHDEAAWADRVWRPLQIFAEL